ncbi:hypothetical protein BDK51DRAFT_31110, partial [Blyttiomyces helicus]
VCEAMRAKLEIKAMRRWGNSHRAKKRSYLSSAPGSMLEPHEGNAIVGPLNKASIKDQLLRIRSGDRFWWENPGVLTEDEMVEMNNYSGLGQLILDNSLITMMPEGGDTAPIRLAQTMIRNHRKSNPLRVVAACELVPGLSCSTSAASSTEEGINVMGMITLKWVMNNSMTNNPAITFTIKSNSTGWFGFGLGDNMNSPADIYLCIPGPEELFWTVQDSYSTDFVAPKADILVGGTDDIFDIEDLTSTQTGSKRVLRFTRYLNTGDTRDIVIESGTMPLLFAYGDVLTPGYHGPNDRTKASLDFFVSGSGVLAVSSSSTAISKQVKILHGIIMAVTFGILYPTGIFIARFWDDPRWLKYHQPVMSMASESMILAAITALISNNGDLTLTHPRLGLAIASLNVVSIVSGLLVAKVLTRHPLKGSKYIRKAHKFAGYVGYLAGVTNGSLGVLDISENDWGLVGLFLACNVCVVFSLFGIRQIWRMRIVVPTMEHSRWSITMQVDSSPLFLWAEVDHRVRGGAKWMVIDSLV